MIKINRINNPKFGKLRGSISLLFLSLYYFYLHLCVKLLLPHLSSDVLWYGKAVAATQHLGKRLHLSRSQGLRNFQSWHALGVREKIHGRYPISIRLPSQMTTKTILTSEQEPSVWNKARMASYNRNVIYDKTLQLNVLWLQDAHHVLVTQLTKYASFPCYHLSRLH